MRRDPILSTVHAAALGAWLGAAAIVSFAVAPAAFAALPSRSAAGTFVGALLRTLHLAGVLSGVVGILVPALRGGRWKRARILAGVVVAAQAVASLALASRIAALRAELGPIEALSSGDPGRQAFGMLHGASVVVLLVGMAAALLAIVFESAAQGGSDGS